MEKSPEAFRTISEVADLLDTPAHVLRFWESRFPQIRPVKRAGGRRYYRPGDVALLSGIKRLLHDEGMTIRGVQKILREHGIRHVAALAPGGIPDHEPAEDEALRLAQRDLIEDDADIPLLPPEAAQTAQIISLEAALQRSERAPPMQPDLWQGTLDEAGQSTPPDMPPADAEVAEAPFVDVDMAETLGDDAPAVAPVETLSPPAPATEPEPEPAAGASPEPEPSVSNDSSATVSPAPGGPVSEDEVMPAALLRRVRAADLAHRQAELQALHARAVELRNRLAQVAQRRAR